ncbi:MAG: hypothetical protein Tsb002_14590 [Wenzhouxiangellaceae bacterium]
MLLLTRRNGEKINLYPATDCLDITLREAFKNGCVTIQVLGAERGQAKIGVAAPQALSILRSELQRK